VTKEPVVKYVVEVGKSNVYGPGGKSRTFGISAMGFTIAMSYFEHLQNITDTAIVSTKNMVCIRRNKDVSRLQGALRSTLWRLVARVDISVFPDADYMY
jgi:hypothetical protein